MSPPTTTPFATAQKSSFVGAGPRLGVQGDIPLGGQWSIDWLAGAAVLFGERQLEQTTAITGNALFVQTSSDSPAVFYVESRPILLVQSEP
jgi:Legionella pneumophila major outer membrane protein precursor